MGVFQRESVTKGPGKTTTFCTCNIHKVDVLVNKIKINTYVWLLSKVSKSTTVLINGVKCKTIYLTNKCLKHNKMTERQKDRVQD